MNDNCNNGKLPFLKNVALRMNVFVSARIPR